MMVDGKVGWSKGAILQSPGGQRGHLFSTYLIFLVSLKSYLHKSIFLGFQCKLASSLVWCARLQGNGRAVQPAASTMFCYTNTAQMGTVLTSDNTTCGDTVKKYPFKEQLR